MAWQVTDHAILEEPGNRNVRIELRSWLHAYHCLV